MNLRKYHPDDCEEVYELFYGTIHSINSADYTEIQLDAWAPKEMDLHLWNQRLLRNDYAIVAEQNGVIIGIGTADDIGYFDLLYVHKDYQKNGVATLIADNIEKYFIENRIHTITTDASITAKPFFEKRGYVVRAEQNVECREQYLINYKMMKSIKESAE
ncbi:MAG: GNAT family N-acetyltransferase [Clostridiales bacterium GWF2_38_85]|nr:MAG: GNAT family N-acetyltransferase [Clostridiales bacterium GWF2_38_85]